MIKIVWGWIALLLCQPVFADTPLHVPTPSEDAKEYAARFQVTADTVLNPVYPYLAEWIRDELQIQTLPGIGIDLGGGPGHLVFTLCQVTEAMYWINADINPYFSARFAEDALKLGVADRVCTIFADAKWLPFRDDYADVIVSRGSFPFWGDLKLSLQEVYRVLKPGGKALIGRGLPPTMPPAQAALVRKQSGGPKNYTVDETRKEFQQYPRCPGYPSCPHPDSATGREQWDQLWDLASD